MGFQQRLTTMLVLWFKTTVILAAFIAGIEAQLDIWARMTPFCNSPSAQSSRRHLGSKSSKNSKCAKTKKGKKKAKSCNNNKKNIVNVLKGIKKASDFGRFLEFLDFGTDPGPLTVFAPTNKVFEENLGWSELLPILEKDDDERTPEEVAKLIQVEPYVFEILGTHLVDTDKLMSNDITDGLQITPANPGRLLEFKIEGDVVTVNGTEIIKTDFKATNGVVHVVDGMLVSPSDAPKFLPTNPEACIACNVAFQPPLSTLFLLFDKISDCLDSPVGYDADEACLMEMLVNDKDGSYTLFAPINDALPPVTDIDDIVEDVGLEFFEILLSYHVVEGAYMASDIANGMEITTLQGEVLNFMVDDNGVTVNDVPIVFADMESINGYIHAIGGLLIPEELGP